jgi:hypothetical protein
MVTLSNSEPSYPQMATIAILVMLVIFAGATLSLTGFSVTSSVVAQMTSDNATMSGNMTDGNVTGGNTTGTISSTAPPGGNTTGTISSTAPPGGNTTGTISSFEDQQPADPDGGGGDDGDDGGGDDG